MYKIIIGITKQLQDILLDVFYNDWFKHETTYLCY